jgi:hypothetical protein
MDAVGAPCPACNFQVASLGCDWENSVCGCRDASSIIDRTSFEIDVAKGIQQLAEE